MPFHFTCNIHNSPASNSPLTHADWLWNKKTLTHSLNVSFRDDDYIKSKFVLILRVIFKKFTAKWVCCNLSLSLALCVHKNWISQHSRSLIYDWLHQNKNMKKNKCELSKLRSLHYGNFASPERINKNDLADFNETPHKCYSYSKVDMWKFSWKLEKRKMSY